MCATLVPVKVGKPFAVDGAALARAGHSGVLAVDPSIMGGMLALPLEAPSVTMLAEAGDRAKQGEGEDVPDNSLIALVSIDGPLAQRGQEHICGFLDGHDFVSNRFTEAIGDPKAGSVLLRIDSPGGDVAGLEQAVARMVAAKEATGKHVTAFVDEMAASAAYWIAAAVADEIVLPSAGQVGSIGTIGAFVDETEALEADGIKVTIVRSPDGKAAMHPAGPVEPQATERLTKLVEASTGRFFAAMADARGLKVKAIRGLDAAMLRGQEAVDEGLADRVGSFEDALSGAASAAQERKTTMEARERAALAAGLDNTDASDAEIFDALVALATERDASLDVRELGADVETLTGAEGPAALAAVSVWRDKAATADQIAAEAEAQAKAHEAIERDRLCVSLVVDGKTPPARVWADPIVAGDPELRTPRGVFARMTIEELRDEVDQAKAHPMATATESTARAGNGVAGLTEMEIKRCEQKARAYGLSVEEYSELYARNKAKNQAGGLRTVKG